MMPMAPIPTNNDTCTKIESPVPSVVEVDLKGRTDGIRCQPRINYRVGILDSKKQEFTGR